MVKTFNYILLILFLVYGMLPTWAQPVAGDDIGTRPKQMYQRYGKHDETAIDDVANR